MNNQNPFDLNESACNKILVGIEKTLQNSDHTLNMTSLDSPINSTKEYFNLTSFQVASTSALMNEHESDSNMSTTSEKSIKNKKRMQKKSKKQPNGKFER
jgi:hypothetical protein